MRQGYLLLFKIVSEVLGCKLKQEKEINGTHIEKKEVKLSLFAGNMMPNRKSHEITKKLPKLIIEFINVAGHKINI